MAAIDTRIEDTLRAAGRPTTSRGLAETLQAQGITHSQVRNALFRLRKRGRVQTAKDGRDTTYVVSGAAG